MNVMFMHRETRFFKAGIHHIQNSVAHLTRRIDVSRLLLTMMTELMNELIWCNRHCINLGHRTLYKTVIKLKIYDFLKISMLKDLSCPVTASINTVFAISDPCIIHNVHLRGGDIWGTFCIS